MASKLWCRISVTRSRPSPPGPPRPPPPPPPPCPDFPSPGADMSSGLRKPLEARLFLEVRGGAAESLDEDSGRLLRREENILCGWMITVLVSPVARSIGHVAYLFARTSMTRGDRTRLPRRSLSGSPALALGPRAAAPASDCGHAAKAQCSGGAGPARPGAPHGEAKRE